MRAGRLSKRWRYVGVFSAGLSLCAARVRVGPLTQEFWAVWDGEVLHERTRRLPGRVRVSGERVRVQDEATRIDVRVSAAPAIEVETAYGPASAWTRKQVCGRARGTVLVGGVSHAVDGLAVVDDSAGYPPRRTSWLWSAGVGLATDGRVVGWNTTVGLHDVPPRTESAVWVDGVPGSAPVGRIAPDLSGISGDGWDLDFTAAAVRRRSQSLLVIRSSYEQPFGSFTGTLPGGIELASAHGVMERHDALW